MSCDKCEQPLQPWETTTCEPCGEILQDSSASVLTQTDKQSTLHQPGRKVRHRETNNQQGAKTMKNTNPYRTIYHHDGSVTLWNCLTGNWQRTSNPSVVLLATLSERERSRVLRHCGIR